MAKKLHIIQSPGGSRLWPAADDSLARQSLNRCRRVIVRYITPKSCARTIDRLRRFEAANPNLPITLMFDSLGGCIEEVGPIVAEVRRLSRLCPVRSVACGRTHSAAVSIFLACDKRKRYAANGSTMLLHFASNQPTITASSRAAMLAQMKKEVSQLWKIERRDRAWIAARTGLTPRTVTALCRDGELRKELLDPHMMASLGFASSVLEGFHPLKPHPAIDGWLR